MESTRLEAIPSLVEGLPDFRPEDAACGPHETCQWVLPQLIAGSFPGERTEPAHTQKVQRLIDAKVDSFLCLQEAAELRRFTPYMEIAKLSHQTAGRPGELEFFHCPMPDLDTTSDEDLLKAVHTIVQKLLEGRTVYVHCWGGHGRTGTVICTFLATCYGLSVQQAAEFYNAGGQMRKVRNPGAGFWPHSAAQKLGRFVMLFTLCFALIRVDPTEHAAPLPSFAPNIENTSSRPTPGEPFLQSMICRYLRVFWCKAYTIQVYFKYCQV